MTGACCAFALTGPPGGKSPARDRGRPRHQRAEARRPRRRGGHACSDDAVPRPARCWPRRWTTNRQVPPDHCGSQNDGAFRERQLRGCEEITPDGAQTLLFVLPASPRRRTDRSILRHKQGWLYRTDWAFFDSPHGEKDGPFKLIAHGWRCESCRARAASQEIKFWNRRRVEPPWIFLWGFCVERRQERRLPMIPGVTLDAGQKRERVR